ncbi:hypothetical protein B0H14DRAFT_2699891 [Mycena olivaceomarginata]|nr:hypothetical protein B0H14DRAFT_2699891 [Mycena olivaceomarginata]
MPVALDKLHEDVLLRILVLTDIYTVLAVSQTCFLRGLIDIPSDEVFTLSTDELVAEVKRAVFGPRTWSSNSSTTPTLIRQFTVPLEGSRVVYESLLPGGRYIMVRKWDGQTGLSNILECWNVSTGRLVWSWNRPDCGIREIAVDTRPGPKLTVALNIIWLSRRPAYVEVLVLEVNLESGHSREITRFSGEHFHQTQIADDYVCCGCSWGDTRLPLLVDHRTEQYQYIAIEECVMTQPWNLHLVPSHIVLIHPESVPISVRVYAISSLWRPLSEFNPRNVRYELALTPTALPVINDVIPIGRGNRRKERVLLVESLLRRHTYLLRGFDMFSLHQNPHVPNNIRTISTQRLDFSEGQTPACTPVSTLVQSPFISEVEAMNMYFSRAGYAVDNVLSDGNCVYVNCGYVFQPEDCTARGIELDVGGPRAHTAFLAQNGGLVVLHESGAEILYYD